MDEKTRQALGVLVLAAIATLVWLVVDGDSGHTAESIKTLALLIAVVTAVIGLVLLAVGLLRPQRD